jgi:hypothetical protein
MPDTLHRMHNLSAFASEFLFGMARLWPARVAIDGARRGWRFPVVGSIRRDLDERRWDAALGQARAESLARVARDGGAPTMHAKAAEGYLEELEGRDPEAAKRILTRAEELIRVQGPRSGSAIRRAIRAETAGMWTAAALLIVGVATGARLVISGNTIAGVVVFLLPLALTAAATRLDPRPLRR